MVRSDPRRHRDHHAGFKGHETADGKTGVGATLEASGSCATDAGFASPRTFSPLLWRPRPCKTLHAKRRPSASVLQTLKLNQNFQHPISGESDVRWFDDNLADDFLNSSPGGSSIARHSCSGSQRLCRWLTCDLSASSARTHPGSRRRASSMPDREGEEASTAPYRRLVTPADAPHAPAGSAADAAMPELRSGFLVRAQRPAPGRCAGTARQDVPLGNDRRIHGHKRGSLRRRLKGRVLPGGGDWCCCVYLRRHRRTLYVRRLSAHRARVDLIYVSCDGIFDIAPGLASVHTAGQGVGLQNTALRSARVKRRRELPLAQPSSQSASAGATATGMVTDVCPSL